MIDITVLGTGALLPKPERKLSEVVLACEGNSILFDCGEGTQSAAAEYSCSLMKTGIIALTHYHGDHIFGLPGLMQTMSVLGREKKLTVIAPPGIEKELSAILKLAGTLNYPVELIEAGTEPLKLCEIDSGWNERAYLTPVKTEHRVVSRGYVFTLGRAGKFMPEKARALGIPVNLWSVLQSGNCAGGFKPEDVTGEERRGLKITVTGDTMYCDSLVKGAENSDLLISEATYGDDSDYEIACERGHMTFRKASELAKNANAKKLLLTHFSQKMREPEEFLGNARELFENSEIAVDGMKISIKFEE